MAISLFKALAFGFFPVIPSSYPPGITGKVERMRTSPSALTSVRPQVCRLSLYLTQVDARIANCRTATDWLGLYWICREDLTIFTWCDRSTGIQNHRLLHKVLQESVGLSADMPKIFLFSVHLCVFLQFDIGFYRIWSTVTLMH
jgi:hypothetical protein